MINLKRFNPNLGNYGESHDLPELYWNVRSSEQRIKIIFDELDRLDKTTVRLFSNDKELNKYLDKLKVETHKLRNEINSISENLNSLIEGGRSRNPVTGNFDKIYVLTKQMYDSLRFFASTWEEVEESGKTWSDIENMDLSYKEFDLFGNDYFGEGEKRANFTESNDIDVNTPGFGGNIYGY